MSPEHMKGWEEANEKDAASGEWEELADLIRHKLKFVQTRPLVLCLSALDPPQSAGGRLPEWVELAGGRFLDVEGNDPAELPDKVLLILPGVSLGESLGSIGQLFRQSWFAQSPALKENQVYVLNGKEYFRPGEAQRTADLEILAEVIGSADFYFGREGEGWIRFQAG